jgi:uncharacterized protein (TIGR03067 family)
MMWVVACALLLVGLSVPADDDKGEQKFDPARLAGTWTYVSGEKNGEKLDKEHFGDSKLTITDKTITLEGPPGKFVMEYTLDAKKTPIGISMKMTESPFGAGATAEGILELKDNDVKMCYATSGDALKKFEAKEGSNYHLFVLKRSK